MEEYLQQEVCLDGWALRSGIGESSGCLRRRSKYILQN